MRNFLLGVFVLFTAGMLSAETLQFDCKPRRDRETPYRTFLVTIFNADSDDAQSEISYSMFPNKDALVPDSAGILDGFSQSETYSTHLSSRYRNITIESGILGFSWQRDTLQLQKRRDTLYRGLFSFPEGSEQLDLGWNSTLSLECDRIL